MAEYRAYLVGRGGHFKKAIDFETADDAKRESIKPRESGDVLCPAGDLNKSRRRVEISATASRKLGVIRNPLNILVTSCEQKVTAFRRKVGDMPTLLRSGEPVY